MNDFFEKWRSDSRYRTKIKLIAYTIFFVIVSVYALSLKDKTIENEPQEPEEIKQTDKVAFAIPENYNYIIDVIINDNEYKYTGEKNINQKTITKEIDGVITNYLYQDNDYYILTDGAYLKTTKEEVYDIVNYNYLSLENINTYLSKAENNNDQYLVYLKDVILNNDSDDYFVILIRNNNINIDYTPLVKYFDSNIEKYKVDIKIEKKD